MKKKITPQEARQKIYRYCAYQERSHSEVRDKLYSFGLFHDDVEEIISLLITENYLNEERFAKAFAGGKFRMKKWGRIKITRELEARDISPYCINVSLKEIDDDSYHRTLDALIEKKAARTTDNDAFVRRDKIAQYIIQKGYEPELVWQRVKAITK